jgi:hypothetical protein
LIGAESALAGTANGAPLHNKAAAQRPRNGRRQNKNPFLMAGSIFPFAEKASARRRLA